MLSGGWPPPLAPCYTWGMCLPSEAEPMNPSGIPAAYGQDDVVTVRADYLGLDRSWMWIPPPSSQHPTQESAMQSRAEWDSLLRAPSYEEQIEEQGLAILPPEETPAPCPICRVQPGERPLMLSEMSCWRCGWRRG